MSTITVSFALPDSQRGRVDQPVLSYECSIAVEYVQKLIRIGPQEQVKERALGSAR